jgi:7-carboxy-7-deazaguanine synthase
MSYIINEIFYTIQGEGYWTGRAAVFCRFSRCNLWTGREKDRASAVCNFCDTDFVAGEKFNLDDLAQAIFQAWPYPAHKPMVVFTGGEPLLQLDEPLIKKVKDYGFYVAVETNGTMPVPTGVDWVCVSPKILTRLVVDAADELKLVYPQLDIGPQAFDGYQAKHKWLSPMDGPEYAANLEAAIKYVQMDPVWRLNIQTHKLIGVK